MRVALHNHLGKPLVVSATRVLICADDGTPLAFSVEVSPGHWRHFRVGDEDFQEQLHNHGIDKTVTEEVLDPKTLKPKTPEVNGRPWHY